jgi:hypothetical protein
MRDLLPKLLSSLILFSSAKTTEVEPKITRVGKNLKGNANEDTQEEDTQAHQVARTTYKYLRPTHQPNPLHVHICKYSTASSKGQCSY